MSRRASRTHAFSILYQLPFHAEFDTHAVTEEYLAQVTGPTPADREFVFTLVEGAAAHLAEIDQLIADLAVGWAFDRIATVDLAILRLAIFEMRYQEVPVAVAINEAVELAKVYGTDDSPGFVNGLLAQAWRDK